MEVVFVVELVVNDEAVPDEAEEDIELEDLLIVVNAIDAKLVVVG